MAILVDRLEHSESRLLLLLLLLQQSITLNRFELVDNFTAVLVRLLFAQIEAIHRSVRHL